MIDGLVSLLRNPWLWGSYWLAFSAVGWSLVYITGLEMRKWVDWEVRRGLDGKPFLDCASRYLRLAHAWLHTGYAFFIAMMVSMMAGIV